MKRAAKAFFIYGGGAFLVLFIAFKTGLRRTYWAEPMSWEEAIDAVPFLVYFAAGIGLCAAARPSIMKALGRTGETQPAASTITAEKAIDPIAKAASGVFARMLIVVLGLVLLTYRSGVRVTGVHDWRWMIGYGVTLLVLLSSLGTALFRRHARIVGAGGTLKKVVYSLAGSLGFAVLSAVAVFSGVPTLLHHLTSVDGELTVTVIKKEERRESYTYCHPRLIIEEFTFFDGNYLCPGERAFAQIDVGSKITLKGKVSRFGIEPQDIAWTRSKG